MFEIRIRKKKATEKKHRRKKILFLLYFKPTRAAAASFADFDYRSREAICIPCIIEHAPLVNGREPVFCRLETVARFHYGREPFLAPLLFSTPPLSFFSFFFVLFRTRKSALVPERERGRGSERETAACPGWSILRELCTGIRERVHRGSIIVVALATLSLSLSVCCVPCSHRVVVFRGFFWGA